MATELIDSAPLPRGRLPFMTRRRRETFNSAVLERAVAVAVEPHKLQHLPERDRSLVESVAQAMQKASGPSIAPLGKRPPSLSQQMSQTRGGAPPSGAVKPVSVDALARNAANALRPSMMVTPAEIEVELRRQGIEWTEPFAPGRPLSPYYGYNRRPRQFDYKVGRNITTDTRPDRLPFSLLKQVVENYDLATICIRHIINDLRSMKLEFSPMEDYEGDVSKEIKLAKAFLRRPDGHRNFNTWLAMYMVDVLRFDAGCLAKERNRAGKLVRLPVISGTTVAPIVDYYGDIPAPPAPAFQQFVQGIPWDWLSSDEVVYEPQWPVPESPYGVAPIETCLLNANTDVRLQMFFLGFFTDGVVPEMLASAPEGMTDPDSLAELQETWDDWYQSNQVGRHGLRWIPSGAKPYPYKPDKMDSVFAEYVMRRTVAAYGLVPDDLGFTTTVNRATADTQVDVQFRITTLPNTEYVEAILDAILQEELQIPVAVHFDTGREKEDRLMEAQAQQFYVSMGAKSADEVRTGVLGLPVDNENPVPRMYESPRLGPVPIAWMQAVSGKIDPNTLTPVKPPPPMPYIPLEGISESSGSSPAADQTEPPDNPSLPPGDVHHQRTGDLHTGADRHPVSGGRTPRGSSSPARRAATGKGMSKGSLTQGMTASTNLAGLTLGEGEDDQEEETKEEFKKELLRWRDNTRSRLSRGQPPRYFDSHLLPSSVRDQVWLLLQGVVSREASDEIFAKALDGVGGHRDDRAAGLALRALDTGRVLMLQRAWDQEDDNRGRWEFPGGHPHPGESMEAAARREWQEEVGVHLPSTVQPQTTWDAPNGHYRGHVMTLPRESDLQLDGREEVPNPDGDHFEAVAWLEPGHLSNHPGLRHELAADVGQVQSAIGRGALVPA